MRTLRTPVSPANMPASGLSERRDPAPSRWAYRMQRLWLTPLFRVLFRFGLPVLGVALVAAIYLASADRRGALISAYDEFKTQFQNRPEFIVSLISVEGASADLSDAIRARMALKLPLSSFDIDLNAEREKIEALDAVARAELRVRTGGTLEVAITERQPALIWRLDDQTLQMIDATGHRVAGLAERQDRPDLPLVAGEGADLAAADAMQIIAAAAPIVPRLRGLVRMGDRRWDLVLDRDQRILLPADQPVRAIERLLALDKAENLLARDIQTVDLRNGDHPVIGLGRHAFAEIRRARGIEVPENDL
jgi:cell division protein FtsQ